MLVEEIEPALADRYRPRMGEQPAQALLVSLAPGRGFVRVDAERAPDIFLGLAEAQDLLRLVEAKRRDEKAVDTGRARAVERGRPLRRREATGDDNGSR